MTREVVRTVDVPITQEVVVEKVVERVVHESVPVHREEHVTVPIYSQEFVNVRTAPGSLRSPLNPLPL